MIGIDKFPTVVDLNESTSDKLVFCIHPAGGGVDPYKKLAKELEHKARMIGLDDPSIYDYQSYDSIPDLAEYHIEIIQAIQPTGPYYLFGNCSGGPLAYEIAYQLTLDGEKVPFLAMFGSHELVGFDPSETSKYGFLPDYLKRKFSIDVGQLNWNEMESQSIDNVTKNIIDELINQDVLDKNKDSNWISRSLRSVCLSRFASKRYQAPTSSINIQLYKQPRAEGKDQVIFVKKDWCDWEKLTTGELTVVEHNRLMTIHDDILAEPHISKTIQNLERYSLCHL
ncbi:thioesterase domain-containing protein [Alteromonas sp. 76-1]|uniref:thioesterase domain-containing protein n=1 Tax=Alteromonas sp. 76-1 TaxID=2358187 RepID=UPI000FD17203|nr:thioesterase domain-containing protein [Alteromonas sp. 76-1]VEL98327.1 thioesterase domain-containing protein [Alteromonas sp. 76-1]